MHSELNKPLVEKFDTLILQRVVISEKISVKYFELPVSRFWKDMIVKTYVILNLEMMTIATVDEKHLLRL